jgi:hypothetical protein
MNKPSHEVCYDLHRLVCEPILLRQILHMFSDLLLGEHPPKDRCAELKQ